MKYLFILLCIVALFVTKSFGQSESAISAATKLVQPAGGGDQIETPLSSLSRGIIDKYGRVILNGVDTTLKLYNTTNSYTYTITPPVPSGNVTLALPVGGGTLVATPTTLEWQFTGADFNTVLTQVEPTIGDTVITLPDTANVDTSLLMSTLTTNSLSAANSIWGVSNGLAFEGATANAFETTLAAVDPTADQTVSIPNVGVASALLFSTLTTNTVDAANSIWLASNSVVLEGATADGFETTLSPVDPTADQTVSIANVGVSNSLMFNTLTTNTIDAANAIWFASSAIVLEGATADGFETTLAPVDPTADQTVSIPNVGVASAMLFSTLTTNTVDAANSIWFASNAMVFEGATADAFETTIAPADATADTTQTIPAAAVSGTVEVISVQAEAATDTITAGQLYGGVITNTGAVGAAVYTLPAPAVGMHFRVYLTVAQDVDINPADGTQILALTDAAGDAISSAATVGNCIELVALSTTTWAAFAVSGTWTDAN